jgi:hypothetical protein
MQEELTSLFHYLEKEEISIDKKEFDFQLQSHPDYPSLMAIVDTCDFFNIENGAINVDVSELELLPKQFVAYLNDETNNARLHYIEKKDEDYIELKNRKVTVIAKEEITKRWKGVVLLVEKSQTEISVSKNSKMSISLFFIVVAFVVVLSQFNENFYVKLFFLLPALGFLLSVAALKDLFGAKSELINNFCRMTATESCNVVVDSNKWLIFKYLNFSDLSIVFFASQFISLFLFILTENVASFFIINKLLFLGAIPLIVLSLYYQKFVEKKWCSICLTISFLLLVELGFIVSLNLDDYNITLQSVTLFGFIFTTTFFGWRSLRKIMSQHKDLKEFQFKGSRFIKNYEIFKNTLIASNPLLDDLNKNHKILIGNKESPVKITVISSPFCGHCRGVHSLMEEILERHNDKVCFDIRFNFNAELADERSKKIHEYLLSLYYKNGEESFRNGLKNWFEVNDKNVEIDAAITVEMKTKINDLLENQFSWNQKNNLNFTPVILINHFAYPKQYERNDLIYFINELFDDEYFRYEKNSFN